MATKARELTKKEQLDLLTAWETRLIRLGRASDAECLHRIILGLASGEVPLEASTNLAVEPELCVAGDCHNGQPCQANCDHRDCNVAVAVVETLCLCGGELDGLGHCVQPGCVASCQHPLDQLLTGDSEVTDEFMITVECQACGAKGIDCCPIDYRWQLEDIDRAVAFDRACFICGEPGVDLSRQAGDLCGACS
jgi:hypothetical protein